ncbi:hypothetical protein KAU45_10205 [bacterium]|nr:hypothetical protein [bacterium]
MLSSFEAQLKLVISEDLYNALNDAFKGVILNYRYKKWDESAKHVGQFVEASVRLIQAKTIGTVTPLTKKIKVTNELNAIINSKPGYKRPYGSLLAQSLRFIYLIRNQQDVLHIAQDHNKFIISTICQSTVIWFMYTFLKNEGLSDNQLDELYHLQYKDTPLVMYCGDCMKTYDHTILKKDQVLIVLYSSPDGLGPKSLQTNTDYRNITNFKKILAELETIRLIYIQNGLYKITAKGTHYVEKSFLS